MSLTGARRFFSEGGRRPRKEANKGPEPTRYSAGKLVAKDSGSVVIPTSRATAQTVCTTQVSALASLTEKVPVACVVRGGRESRQAS